MINNIKRKWDTDSQGEVGNALDYSEELYWEAPEMITGYNTDPKKENYLDNSPHFEVDNDLDYSEEIFWEAPETLTAHNTDPEKKSYLDDSAQFKEGPKKKNH